MKEHLATGGEGLEGLERYSSVIALELLDELQACFSKHCRSGVGTFCFVTIHTPCKVDGNSSK